MFVQKSLSLLLFAFFSVSWAIAKDNQEKELEVLTVYEQAPAFSSNYQIISREEFAHTSQTLSDLLQSINGLQIRQIGGLGNPVSVSIRGSSNKQVQLYIDGQLVNDSQFGGFDLNQIPTDQIQSIEISKNQAIGTGSTPIGGVIRVNTYNPSKDKLKLSAALGAFHYKEVNLLFNKAFEQHSLSLAGSYLQTDNNYDYLVPQSFINSNESTTEALRNNQFEKKHLAINHNLSFDKHKIRLSLQYNEQDKALPNYQNNTPENSSRLSSDTWRLGYVHNIYTPLDWLDNLELEIYREDKKENYLDILAQVTRLDGNYHTVKTHGDITSSLVFDSPLGSIGVSPFIEINQQTFDSLSFDSNGQISCNGISSCDVVAEQTQSLLGSRVEWQQANGPLSAYSLLTRLNEKNQNEALNQANAELFSNSQNYDTQELGLSFKEQRLQAELLASKGIRTPTLFELFGDRGLFKGSDNLLPEESKTVNLGMVYQDELAQIDYSLHSSIYLQQATNAIVAIFNSSGVGAYENVSDADIKGLEIETKLLLSSSLSLNLQANVIDSKTHSVIKSFNLKKLPGIYHQQYSVSMNYQLTENWGVYLRSAIDQDLYFNRANIFDSNNGQPGKPAKRKVTDFRLNYATGIYHFNLSVNNLFDQTYQDLANRPAQGRNIQFKLSIEGI